MFLKKKKSNVCSVYSYEKKGIIRNESRVRSDEEELNYSNRGQERAAAGG